MSDFEEKLNAILSNPDAMAQIAGLAQSLDLGGGNNGGNSGGAAVSGPFSAPASAPAPASGGNGGLGALSGLGDLLGNVDPKFIARLLPLVGELSDGSGSDDRMALLYALRPFLNPERREKVDQAARLIHGGKKLLSALGESHV